MRRGSLPLFLLSAIFGGSLWAAANIYFVYGDLGGNGLRGDPTYDFDRMALIEAPQMQWLRNKGYFVNRVYGINAETFLRILNDQETLAVFYVGHARATAEEARREEGNLSVVSGGDYVDFNRETVALAKARLKLGGFDYKPAESLRFIHLGSCFSASCRPLFFNDLGINIPIYAFSKSLGPRELIQSYRGGGAAAWLNALPPASGPRKQMTGWDELVKHYNRTLADDLVTLRIGNRKDYRISELVDILEKSWATAEQHKKILMLAEAKLQTWNDVNALMQDRAREEEGEAETLHRARLEFLIRVAPRLNAPLSEIKQTLWNASTTGQNYIEFLEQIALPRVQSPDDLTELVSFPSEASLPMKKLLESFIQRQRAELETKLGSTPAQKRQLSQAISLNCHGRLRRLFDGLAGLW